MFNEKNKKINALAQNISKQQKNVIDEMYSLLNVIDTESKSDFLEGIVMTMIHSEQTILELKTTGKINVEKELSELRILQNELNIINDYIKKYSNKTNDNNIISNVQHKL